MSLASDLELGVVVLLVRLDPGSCAMGNSHQCTALVVSIPLLPLQLTGGILPPADLDELSHAIVSGKLGGIQTFQSFLTCLMSATSLGILNGVLRRGCRNCL